MPLINIIDEKLIDQLSTDQKEHLKTAQWLVNDGPRISGRSYVLAMAFLRKAIHTNQKVFVYDHFKVTNHHLHHFYNLIISIVNRLNNELDFPTELIVRINQQERSIKTEWIPKDGH